MFDYTLLESSPVRAPVLKKAHYVYALACGISASLISFLVLRSLFPPVLTRALTIHSLVFGTVVTALALMLCYVYAESRQLALNTAFWVGLIFVLNFAGFVCFLVYTAARTGDWRRAAVPFAYIGEALLVAALALVPLIHTDALPRAVWREILAGGLPSPPSPPPSSSAPQTMRRATRALSSEDILKAPLLIPRNVAQVHDEPLPSEPAPSSFFGVPGGITNGQSAAGIELLMRSILSNPLPQPPIQQRPNPPRPERIRVGGNVSAARLIFQPKPEYPQLARIARAEGAVALEAVIGKDGTIEELKVLQGNPLLIHAAIEAVRQWRYQPTLLNGEPIEVVTEITVNFKLAD